VHSAQGIAMLLASVFVLYAFDGLLERLRVPGGRSPARARSREPVPPLGRRLAWGYGMLALLGLLSLAITPWRMPSPGGALPDDAIPRRLGEWRSADLQTDRLFLGMAALTGMVDRRYVLTGESVDVFVAAGSPRQRFRSFYSPKTALPGSGWIIEERGARELEGREVDVLVVRKESERRLVYHWYEGTHGFGQELVREALALDASPFTRDRRGVVVRISTPLGASETREWAEDRLEQMASLLEPVLNPASQPPEGT
jgi:EpsI family protein